MDDNTKENTVFDQLGLSVNYGNVEVGNTYPLYGMITDIVSDVPGNVVVVINHGITLNMQLEDVEKIQLLKNRAFDPGIFVTLITEAGNSVKGNCSTVVFGKQPNHSVQ